MRHSRKLELRSSPFEVPQLNILQTAAFRHHSTQRPLREKQKESMVKPHG
jgi:hypothetical protein